jgi:hypothetical protein
MMQTNAATSCGSNRAARAFSLTELIVAVGAAAILTASVGLLFRNVGDLSSNGVAATNLDATARVIERQMRDDFAALSRLSADESFFAIRFREIGDIDRNESVEFTEGERAIYLTEEGREEDLNAGVDPYQRDTNGVPVSAAITTRLDEMIFLGEGEFVSAQSFGGQRAVEAPHARFYWGHGLKPLPDPDFNSDGDYLDATTGQRISAIRQYVPDGDFGTRAGDLFDFASGTAAERSETSTGRNEYATGWSLARQAALLYGGNAPATSFPIDQYTQTIGDRFFAPYITERVLFNRFGEWRFFYPSLPDLGESRFRDEPLIAEPAWLSGGRVDIVAQDRADVQRFLEGELPRLNITRPINSAGAYAAGVFADPLATLSPVQSGRISNQPLWLREADGVLDLDPSTPTDVYNLVGVQSAIAGVFTRPLLDDRVPEVLSRRHDPNAPNFRERPEVEAMDTHALIAPRCSRFEIAWNDGSIAIREIDVDSDGEIDYQPGDAIWFDISPILNPDGSILRRNTLAAWLASSDAADVRFADPRFNDPSILLLDLQRQARYLFPEIIKDDRLADPAGATPISPPERSLFPGLYEPVFNGGSLLLPDSDEPGPEAFAIWGFREPFSDGRFVRPWTKPTLIRVRMTLHDRELRSEEGRDYEFVFSIAPSAD